VNNGSDDSPAGGPIAIDICLVDEPRRSFWRRSSWSYSFGFAIFLMGSMWLTLWTIPNTRLESLEQLVAWCTTSESRARLEPEQCLVGNLTLARLSPLTRARANALHTRAAYEARRRRLINALVNGALTAAERDEQAEQIAVLGLRARSFEVALAGSKMRSIAALDLPVDLIELGALRVASEAAFAEIDAGRPVTWWQVTPAILTRGPYARIGEVAKATADDDDQPSEQGTWLCLLGEREQGAALLAKAEANRPGPNSLWANSGSIDYVIRALCSGEQPQPERAPDYLRWWLAARAAAHDPDALTWTEDSIAANLSILAQLIIRDEPTAVALLDGIGVSETGELPAYATPSLVYGPATLLRAAELSLARAVDAEALPPFEASEPDTPLTPATQLELLAASLAIEAGREYLRRGELERAREALALADHHLPVEQRVPLAWLRLQAGDFEAVLVFASSLRDAIAADERGHDWHGIAELGLLEVEALAAAGQLVRARELLETLPVSLPEWRKTQIEPRLLVLDELSALRVEPTMPSVLLLDEPLRRLRRLTRQTRSYAVLLDANLREDRGVALRQYMWRRAEFARRCGDADEAAYWQTRAAAILGLAKTEDDQLLLEGLQI